MLLKLKLRICNAFWVLELYKTLGKYLNTFYKKNLMFLTNEWIKQKTFGVKPHRLDPGLTIVFPLFVRVLDYYSEEYNAQIYPRFNQILVNPRVNP